MALSRQDADPVADYTLALRRMVDGKPRIVDKGARITNDAVSIEAGRGKGSIKKSRAIFADLIAAIDNAARDQAKPKQNERVKLDRAKSEAKRYREELEAALGREVSLLKELYETKKRLNAVTGADVLPLRSRASSKGRKP